MALLPFGDGLGEGLLYDGRRFGVEHLHLKEFYHLRREEVRSLGYGDFPAEVEHFPAGRPENTVGAVQRVGVNPEGAGGNYISGVPENVRLYLRFCFRVFFLLKFRLRAKEKYYKQILVANDIEFLANICNRSCSVILT